MKSTLSRSTRPNPSVHSWFRKHLDTAEIQNIKAGRVVRSILFRGTKIAGVSRAVVAGPFCRARSQWDESARTA